MVTRRNRGDGFDLWRVRPGGGNPIGVLVTDRERCPNPLAFIPLGAPRSDLMALACAIRDGAIDPGTRGTIDLRGEGWWEKCPDVLNVLLEAIDAAGHVMGSRARFTSGYFVMARGFPRPSFFAAVRPAFQSGPTLAQQKGGTSKTPRLPLSGIVRETKAMATTAA